MSEPVIGWFGKVPARGDFVCHGLPPDWVAGWDACLQQVLRLGGVRGFPPWRFLAWPDGVDERAWAGVLVPSHDRVGRVFPFTVVQALAPHQLQGRGWPAIEAALARLADAALDVTDTADPALTEDFVAVLSGLGPVFGPWPGSPRRRVAGLDMPGAPGGPGGCSLWWCPPVPGAAPQPQWHAWPPEPARLHDLLSAGHATKLPP